MPDTSHVAAYAPRKTLVMKDILSWSLLSHAEKRRDIHTEVKCYIAAVGQDGLNTHTNYQVTYVSTSLWDKLLECDRKSSEEAASWYQGCWGQTSLIESMTDIKGSQVSGQGKHCCLVAWRFLAAETQGLVVSCCKFRRAQQKESLISTLLPDGPWQIDLDLCEDNKQNYLISSD